jgi:hypothetical protein
MAELHYGGFEIKVAARACRCKGEFHCNTYGLAPKDQYEHPNTIPRGEMILKMEVRGHDQPLIYCKEHMKEVFSRMEKVIGEAKAKGLYK